MQRSPHKRNTRLLPRYLQASSAFLVGLLASPVVWAACNCGFTDGLPTLQTITVDGNLVDWAPIHADTDNNICDGPSPGAPPDRDAPVQSTGRDIAHFSYTWDGTNVYLYTERVGSANNVQRFVYYADVDNDGLMELNEPVVGVNWSGNTRLVSVYVFNYSPVVASGDPMVDGMGFGDGYTLPGGFINVPQQNSPNRSGNWGSAGGLAMEFDITWAELGIPVGSPINFHVSSANTYFNAANFPANVDDNLAGCGGFGGGTQYAALTFVPDVDLSGQHNETVVAAHTLTNDGNGDDTWDLTSAISGDHTPTLTYYNDVDASGDLSPGDTPLTDTDGDSVPDTGVLGSGATFNLLIAYTIGFVASYDPSGTATIVTTATSSFDTNVTGAVTDTVTVILVPDPVVAKSVTTISDPVNGGTNPKAIPGALMEYTIRVSNQGGGDIDSDSMIITDAIPSNVEMFVDDLGGAGSGPVIFTDGSPTSTLSYTFSGLGSGTDDLEFSDDNQITWTYTPAPDIDGVDPDVTDIRVSPDGTMPGETASGVPYFSVRFRCRVQ